MLDLLFENPLQRINHRVAGGHGNHVISRHCPRRHVVWPRVAQQVTPSDDSHTTAVSVDDGIGPVSAGLEPLGQLTYGGVHIRSLDVGRHHLPNRRRAQDVGVVLRRDAQASTGQLLGHDAVPRKGRRQEVSDHSREHEGQDRLVVAGELEEKDDRGERRPSRRPECRRHGDEGEGAR